MTGLVSMPDGFRWGVATSAYQVEGAARTDGRTPSIWDAYLLEHGDRGENGDVAADHYARWREDLALLGDLGVTTYRFSVSWSRVLPDGRTLNQKGLDFYRRIVDTLLDLGVEPAVTAYHMDLPQHLGNSGGWSERATAYRFADYAAILGDALGDRVPLWMTVNELYYEAWLGYYDGHFPPGMRDRGAAVAALHHMLLAHGLGRDAIKAAAPGAAVGLVTGYAPVRPATIDPFDLEAAERVQSHTNDAVLSPVLTGEYPVSYVGHPARSSDLRRVVRPGDMETICGTDFIGVNYYYSRYISSARRVDQQGLPEGFGLVEPDLRLAAFADLDAVELAPSGHRPTIAGWVPEPRGLADSLLEITERHGPLPLYVTENGVPLLDDVDPAGQVDDVERIEFLRDHLAELPVAVANGADLRGYFVWSLLDNLEWTSGFSQRFGLVHVDFESQRRTPKASFRWYADAIRRSGGIEPVPHDGAPPTTAQRGE